MNRFTSNLMIRNQHEDRRRFILLLPVGHVTDSDLQMRHLSEFRLDFAQNGGMDSHETFC